MRKLIKPPALVTGPWRLADLKSGVLGAPKNGLKVFSCFHCGGGSTMGSSAPKTIRTAFVVPDHHCPMAEPMEMIEGLGVTVGIPTDLIAPVFRHPVSLMPWVVPEPSVNEDVNPVDQ